MSSVEANLEASPSGGDRRGVRAAGMAATAAALALLVALAVRTIGNWDTGCHLAYGDHLLRTGEIVRTNLFTYTRLDPEILADPANASPGSWYDPKTDTYHFINANWFSQIFMSLANRWGGMSGLVILQAALVGGIFCVLVVAMRRGGVGWVWIGPALILLAFTCHARFCIRSEVFGYLVLAGQLCLLVGRRFGWRGALGLVALQVLAVNVHSYFLLGIALAGAFSVGALARWWRVRKAGGTEAPLAASRLKWLALATAGTALASLANPAFIDGVVLPFHMLAYLKKHGITGVDPSAGADHPWKTVSQLWPEFRLTWKLPWLIEHSGAPRWTETTTAYVVTLALAVPAAVVALLRLRLGWLLALAGMTRVSFQANRNVAVGTMVMVPLIAMIFSDGWSWLRAKTAPKGAARLTPRAGLAVAIASVLLAAWLTWSVVTQRFYFSRRRSWRFGLGPSRAYLPLDAANWINAHNPKGRVFCDHVCSSNVMYLTRPHRKVPGLTHTWAYPPYVMAWIFKVTGGRIPFEPVADEYDVGTVVLTSLGFNDRLIRNLVRDRNWAVVHVDTTYVVFVRARGPNAELARECRVTEATFDVAEFIARVRTADPVPASGLHYGALLLDRMGWTDHAITVWRKCAETDDTYYEVLGVLGRRLLVRGRRKIRTMEDHLRVGRRAQARLFYRQGLDDWTEAERVLRRAVEVFPAHGLARRDLMTLQRDLFLLKRGETFPDERQ